MQFLKMDPADSASDPLMRCDDCKKIVAKYYIMRMGGCNHCGNRRVRSINKMDSVDIEALKNGTYDLGINEYKVDPDFFKMFEEASNVD